MIVRITGRREAVCLLASAILAGATPAAAQATGPYYGHMGDGWWLGWIFGPLMMLVVVGIAIAVIVLVIRWLGDLGGSRAATRRGGRVEPLDILQERFARGEIDKDEYEERRRVLQS